MDRKETGINSNNSNQHPNSDLESQVTKKVKISNENAGSSSSTVAANKSDSGSDVTGEDQNGKNPALIKDDNKSSISNEMDQQEEGEMDSKDILFNLTAEEKALAQQIFTNHLTLRKILDNSSVSKNFEFRLVNKFWEKEATSVIMKASVNQFFLKYNSEKRCDEFWVPGTINKGLLSKLNNCISSSHRFPCSRFVISYSENFDRKELTEFLRLHGQEIKSLVIGDVTSKTTINIASLRKLLLVQAPNIQNLKLFTEIVSSNGEILFPENVILPHLKFLRFLKHCSSQILEIIRASPNLEEVRGDAFKHVDALVFMEKIHVVKTLIIKPDESGSLDLLQKWAEAKPKLALLGFSPLTLNMGKSLSKILDTSQESLVDMGLFLKEDFFNGVLWPKFENVQRLSVWETQNNFQSVPPNFISDVFPNITELDIRVSSGPAVNQFLTTATQLVRLKTVKMNRGYLNLLNLLVRAAPNVENVHVNFVWDFYRTMGVIWGFSKLKKLTLASRLWQNFDSNKFPQLDMAITGLSEKMVRRLHGDAVYFEEMKTKAQKIVRMTASIWDCQALETLILDFGSYRNAGGEIPTLFTSVSGEFGFKLMSRTNTELICTSGHEGAFTSLAPYVKIIKKPNTLEQ